jgi:hypothetical protein
MGYVCRQNEFLKLMTLRQLRFARASWNSSADSKSSVVMAKAVQGVIIHFAA